MMITREKPAYVVPAITGFSVLCFDRTHLEFEDVTQIPIIAWAIASNGASLPIVANGYGIDFDSDDRNVILNPNGVVDDDELGIFKSRLEWFEAKRKATADSALETLV